MDKKSYKKSFYQDELGWIFEFFFIGLFSFACHVFGYFLIIYSIVRTQDAMMISLGVFLIIISGLWFPIIYNVFSWNVRMDCEKVWMNGDVLATKGFRVQKRVIVYFYDIKSIRIETSTKNSSGQTVRTPIAYGLASSSKRFLVLETVSGKKKRLHVSHFTEVSLALIIDEIVDRINQVNSCNYDGKTAADIISSIKK